jgi:hypothetical protein
MAVVWNAMVPLGSRNMPVQLASRASGGRGDDHAGQRVVTDVLAAGEELVVRDDLVAQHKRGLRVADIVRLTGSNGLNTTLKTSVCDLAGPGTEACETAAKDTPPTRPSAKTAAAHARGTFLMAPPPRCPGRPLAVRLLSGQPLIKLGMCEQDCP